MAGRQIVKFESAYLCGFCPDVAKAVQITHLATGKINEELQQELPVGVFGAVEGGGLGFGMHVEYIVAAPGRGVGVVLDGPEIPLGTARHGVLWNAAEETNLLLRAGAGADVHAFNERTQVRWIALAAGLDTD